MPLKLEEMTDIDLLLTEKASVMADPLMLVENEYLTIKTKQGQLVPLKLNSVQRRFLKRIREKIAAKKPIRMWILKARQTGFSTIGMAIDYSYTSQREALNSLVVADDIDGANYLFGMQKLFQETLSPHLRPAPKHSNEKKLEFENIHSQILIDTSDNLSAGRKYTFRLVHLSEVSRFRDLKTLMLGINQAVPNLPETFIICETTANGIANQFYDEWQACKNAQENGLTDWETFFVAWWEVEEYTMPLTNNDLYPIDAMEFATVIDKENFLTDERVQQQRYNLTREQVNWRRWCIINNCNRSILQFNQEYPDSEKTAFISTGDQFFDKEGMGRQEISKPIAVGHIVKDNGYIFREDNLGLFKIYELPQKNGQYIIGADPAEGLEHGDKSAAVVLNKRTNKTVCSYNYNTPPDRFEEDLIKMGSFYNNATIACENNSYGYAINQGLYKRYGKVYRKANTKKGFIEKTLELGWKTNSATRPTMLAQMAQEIYDTATQLVDKDLIQQCWTFINNIKRGQPEAEKGKCDDMVIARAIAGMVRQEQPFKEHFVIPSVKKRFRGLSGY